MPNLEDIILGQTWMVLLKGDNGSGKSISAASFPRPIHFCDFDGRMDSVRYAHRNDMKGISFETYGPTNFWQFVNWFQKLQDGCPYATIVLDSFTSISVSAVTYQLLQKGIGTGRAVAKQSESEGGGGVKTTKGGLIVPGVEEYNGETANISIVLDIAKVLHMYLGINIIMTAHPLPKVNIQSGKTTRAITSYGNKIAAMAPNYFNEIYHFDVEQPMNVGGRPKYFIYTHHGGEDYAKTVFPLPTKIEITRDDESKPFLFQILQAELKKNGIETPTEGKHEVSVKPTNSLKAF